MADSLPCYTVTARNTSATSENKIHDDDVARSYGFRGALVPGVTVYAYLTHPLVEALGTAWLDRGTASVRFLRPILEGEEVLVTGEVTERTAHGLTASLRATTTAGGECAVLTATLPAGSATPVNPTLYREAELPAERPDATREHLAAVDVLGTPRTRYDEACAADYLAGVADGLACYGGAGARVHPAFYLHQSNRALAGNVRMGPWIHVASAIRHLAPARIGQELRTRGRVRSLYDKKGRDFVELDLAVFADGRPVAHVLHTAIYRLPVPA